MSIFKKATYFTNRKCYKVNYSELSLISGSLAQLYKDGIKINEALSLIQEVILTKEYKKSLNSVIKNIEDGITLSIAFEKSAPLYPKFFIGIISIGENSGNLYEALKTLKDYYGKRSFINKYIISSLTYPIMLIIGIIGMVLFSILVVIPSFYDIYSSIGIDPPWSCKSIYKLSIYVKENKFFSSLFFICWGVIIPVISMKSIRKKDYIWILKRFKIFNKFLEYITLFILSIIINSGMNISYGLNYCASSIKFDFIGDKLNIINESILKGSTLSEAVNNANIFSKYTLAVIRVREESGSIGKGLEELSFSLEKSLIKAINKYLNLLQPIFIILISIIIIIFFIVFILPLFDSLKVGVIK